MVHRPRRLRRSPALRNLVRETNLTAHDFVLPLFVSDRIDKRRPIESMPGVFQFTVDEVVDQARAAQDAGLQAVLLFGIPDKKDEKASGAYAENGVIQKALRAIKKKCPEVVAITDVCLCEYMSHGHCGVTRIDGEHFHVLNDESVELLVKTALSHAAAGADIVAPSDMMDGRIGAIREALDASGFDQTGIMSYAAKFASVFYGPFREAAESPPQFGDRRSYQMDFANANEALREVALDIEEGADIVMIKPALPYLDIVWRVRERFGKPIAVYHVSGEHAIVNADTEPPSAVIGHPRSKLDRRPYSNASKHSVICDETIATPDLHGDGSKQYANVASLSKRACARTTPTCTMAIRFSLSSIARTLERLVIVVTHALSVNCARCKIACTTVPSSKN